MLKCTRKDHRMIKKNIGRDDEKEGSQNKRRRESEQTFRNKKCYMMVSNYH